MRRPSQDIPQGPRLQDPHVRMSRQGELSPAPRNPFYRKVSPHGTHFPCPPPRDPHVEEPPEPAPHPQGSTPKENSSPRDPPTQSTDEFDSHKLDSPVQGSPGQDITSANQAHINLPPQNTDQQKYPPQDPPAQIHSEKDPSKIPSTNPTIQLQEASPQSHPEKTPTTQQAVEVPAHYHWMTKTGAGCQTLAPIDNTPTLPPAEDVNSFLNLDPSIEAMFDFGTTASFEIGPLGILLSTREGTTGKSQSSMKERGRGKGKEEGETKKEKGKEKKSSSSNPATNTPPFNKFEPEVKKIKIKAKTWEMTGRRAVNLMRKKVGVWEIISKGNTSSQDSPLPEESEQPKRSTTVPAKLSPRQNTEGIKKSFTLKREKTTLEEGNGERDQLPTKSSIEVPPLDHRQKAFNLHFSAIAKERNAAGKAKASAKTQKSSLLKPPSLILQPPTPTLPHAPLTTNGGPFTTSPKIPDFEDDVKEVFKESIGISPTVRRFFRSSRSTGPAVDEAKHKERSPYDTQRQKLEQPSKSSEPPTAHKMEQPPTPPLTESPSPPSSPNSSPNTSPSTSPKFPDDGWRPSPPHVIMEATKKAPTSPPYDVIAEWWAVPPPSVKTSHVKAFTAQQGRSKHNRKSVVANIAASGSRKDTKCMAHTENIMSGHMSHRDQRMIGNTPDTGKRMSGHISSGDKRVSGHASQTENRTIGNMPTAEKRTSRQVSTAAKRMSGYYTITANPTLRVVMAKRPSRPLSGAFEKRRSMNLRDYQKSKRDSRTLV